MRTVDVENTAERQRQILDAALVSFREKGFRGAAMSTICQRAGMSPGHLYHYFSSKEDIIQALVANTCEQCNQSIQETVGSDDPITAMVEEVARIWDKDFDIRGALSAEIKAEASRNERIAEISRESDVFIRESMARAFATAQERGLINAGIDPLGLATLILALIQGLNAAKDAKTDIDVERTNDAFRELIVRTLRP